MIIPVTPRLVSVGLIALPIPLAVPLVVPLVVAAREVGRRGRRRHPDTETGEAGWRRLPSRRRTVLALDTAVPASVPASVPIAISVSITAVGLLVRLATATATALALGPAWAVVDPSSAMIVLQGYASKTPPSSLRLVPQELNVTPVKRGRGQLRAA